MRHNLLYNRYLSNRVADMPYTYVWGGRQADYCLDSGLYY